MKSLRQIVYACICVSYSIFSGSPIAFSQKNNAELTITVKGSGVPKSDNYSYSILKNDTLVSITKITDLNRFEKKHILKCSLYDIQVFKNDSLYQEFKNITLECGYQVWYTINLAQKSSHEIIENSETPYSEPTSGNYTPGPMEEIAYVNLIYGQGFIENADYPLSSYWGFTSGAYTVKPITRHFGVGFEAGYDVAYSFAKKDSSFRPDLDLGKERYFRFGMDMKFTLRLSTYNMKAYSKYGVFLDFGVGYSLPFWFRHAVIYGNHKDMVRRIHHYNDLFGFLRLGAGPVGFAFYYRFFDYIKDPFPQNPKIMLGISLIIRD